MTATDLTVESRGTGVAVVATVYGMQPIVVAATAATDNTPMRTAHLYRLKPVRMLILGPSFDGTTAMFTGTASAPTR